MKGFRLLSSEAIHPRYLIKSPASTLLFIFLALAGAFIAEPKLIQAVTKGVDDRAIPTATVVMTVVVSSTMLFVLVYLTLRIRYVLRRQAAVASCLFLTLTVSAALVGYAVRSWLAPPEGTSPHVPLPAAYTLQEGLIAVVLLTITGTIFTTAHNVAFLRKVDYTEFGARRDDLLAFIDQIAARFNAGGVLTAADAKSADTRCSAMLTTLDKISASDEPRYRLFVQRHIRPPLLELATFVSDPQVQQAPDLLVRACGLANSQGALSPTTTARLSSSYRTLQDAR